MPVVTDTTAIVAEINKIGSMPNIPPDLKVSLKKLMLLITQHVGKLGDAINQRASVNTNANLPSPGAPGRLFVDTTNTRLYVDDGTAWHYVALT